MRSIGSIYLDYQASTPLDEAILLEMLPFFSESFANPHASDHAAGWAANAAVETARARLSALIGCDSDEIIFTSGASEANSLAVFGRRRSLETGKKCRVVTTGIEHKSVIASCRALAEEYNVEVHFCDVDNSGRLDMERLEKMLSDGAHLLTIGAVNSEIGTIQNIIGISDLASRFGVTLHLDAAQMALASDVSEISSYADMISLSGHKFYGPKGIGCLYIKRELQSRIAPLVFGGGQQNSIRSGTLPVPLCVGMGAAANKIGQMPSERDVLRAKTLKLWKGLSGLSYEAVLNGPPIDERHPGNLNVRFPGFDAEDLLSALQPHLAASTGSACTTGAPEASHVLRAIGLKNEEARSSIRFSVGRLTSEDEIVRAVELVDAALKRFEAAGLKDTA